MRLPSANPITLPFGATSAPYSASNPHKGVDFGWLNSAGQEDKTIYMPEDGIVRLVPNNGNDGNGVYFTVDNRFHGLLHTSQYLVGNGQFVTRGTPVAIMGETGAAQGVHLHWALKIDGQFVNALNYIDKGDEEPMLNQGDVQNLYIKLLNRKAEPNDVAEWVNKPAMDLFYFLSESKEHGQLTYVNDGDTQNFFKLFAGRDATKEDKDFHRGNMFKPTIYNLMANPDIVAHQYGGDYVPVGEPTYIKRKQE